MQPEATMMIFMFSAIYNARPPVNDLNDPHFVNPIQNSVLVCDVRDGRKYQVSAIYPNRKSAKQFDWPDAIEVVAIPGNKFVYLAYTTGPAADVESQADRKGISKEELSRCVGQ